MYMGESVYSVIIIETSVDGYWTSYLVKTPVLLSTGIPDIDLGQRRKTFQATDRARGNYNGVKSNLLQIHSKQRLTNNVLPSGITTATLELEESSGRLRTSMEMA